MFIISSSSVSVGYLRNATIKNMLRSGFSELKTRFVMLIECNGLCPKKVFTYYSKQDDGRIIMAFQSILNG